MGKTTQNHRTVGTVYENKAVLFLQRKGYRILETNFYTRHGEIDIVALDGDYLVFAEVKYRSSTRGGSALEAVTPKKQRRVVQAARFYLHKKHYGEEIPCRFDVIAFDGEGVVHIPDAFTGS